MNALTPITAEVRSLDNRLWDIFYKDGPLTPEEQAYLDAAEAAYAKEYPDE
jgi:hypothetical protein